LRDPISKTQHKKRAGGVAQGEALSSNPGATKKEKNKQNVILGFPSTGITGVRPTPGPGPSGFWVQFSPGPLWEPLKLAPFVGLWVTESERHLLPRWKRGRGHLPVCGSLSGWVSPRLSGLAVPSASWAPPTRWAGDGVDKGAAGRPHGRGRGVGGSARMWVCGASLRPPLATVLLLLGQLSCPLP
jgi:hypothetical protein